jgi:acylphosphatase
MESRNGETGNNEIIKMIKHLNIRVYGNVQGVFYRATAMETALFFDIKGFARNEKDETVYIEAEGEESKLDAFVAWCYIGPPRASVVRVETKEGSMKNFSKFEISR